jgi:hypothetical protein
MTSLVSEMAGPKPRREGDTALNARSRLMMPRGDPSESLTAKLLVAQQSDADEVDSERTDLLIQGLVDRLPKPNAIWSLEDRAKWLRTAASIFDLVYKAKDGEHREISVAFAKQEAERTAKASNQTQRDSA